MPNPTGHTDSIKNSQFKAAWQSGPTRTIRVPIALADATLDYARQLDQGIEPRDTGSKTENQASDLDKNISIEPRDTGNSIDSEVEVNVSSTPDTSDSSSEKFAHALTTPEEALADAAIYGFTPEEALADAHFQIAMLQSNHDELEDKHEAVKREYAALLDSSTHITNKLREEVRELRSQLETEKTRSEDAWEEMEDSEKTLAAVRSENSELAKTCDELRSELSDLEQKSTAASKDLPEAADLLNQLKARRKKSSATLADVELILEMIEES